MRQALVYTNVNTDHVYKKNVVWCDLKGLDPNNAEHAAYLEDMGRDFYEKVG